MRVVQEREGGGKRGEQVRQHAFYPSDDRKQLHMHDDDDDDDDAASEADIGKHTSREEIREAAGSLSRRERETS